MSKIDNILQRLMTATDDLGDGGINKAKVDGYEKILSNAKQQLLELLEECKPEKRKTIKECEGSIGMGWLESEAQPYNEALNEYHSNTRKLFEVEE